LSRVNSDVSLTPPGDRVASRIPARRNAELARARFDSAIIPHLVLAAIRDVGGDGMNPIQWVEGTNGRTSAGIRRCADLEPAVVAPADAVDGKRGSSDVAGEPLKLLRILGGNRLPGENGKTWMDPGKKILHETLREAFLFVQAAKKKTAKNFANSRGIDRGEIEELSFCSPDTIGNDGVQMRGGSWLRRNRKSK